jgi:hypothetical protein
MSLEQDFSPVKGRTMGPSSQEFSGCTAYLDYQFFLFLFLLNKIFLLHRFLYLITLKLNID